MKHLTLPACLLFATLSACNGWGYHKGVGFTGIDGEPKTLSDRSAAPSGVVGRVISTPEALAGLPPVALRTEAVSPAELAGVAIANGGRLPASAVLVGLNGAEMMLSTVQVNGLLFAVLRLPEGQRGRMATGSANAFVAAVPRLTGCLADGGAYAQGGSADRPQGLAVALNCS